MSAEAVFLVWCVVVGLIPFSAITLVALIEANSHLRELRKRRP